MVVNVDEPTGTSKSWVPHRFEGFHYQVGTPGGTLEEERGETKINIISWSGGTDSTVMLHYLIHNTPIEPFKVVFVDSTIIVPDTLTYIDEIVDLFGIGNQYVQLTPKITFYERLLKYSFWPSIRALWCRQILKLDPLKKYYNSFEEPLTENVGISLHDSGQRRKRYSERPTERKWGRKLVAVEYPLINWTDEQKKNYMADNEIPRNPVYDTFRLSGCYFCPYYHEPDYLRLRIYYPELFAKLVDCERVTGKRALPDFWLKDLVTLKKPT